MEQYLEKLYLNENEPTYLSGENALFREAKKKFPKIKVEDVRTFLEKQETYTRHKPVKRYKPLKTIAAGLDVDQQIDLADMRRIKKENNHHGYILTCVDVLSRYAWAVPVKNKSAENVAKAYQKIIDEGRIPWRVFSDKGREFMGEFRKLLEANDIQQIFIENPVVKASLAERYNRTLKSRLYKYFTKSGTYKWIKILPKIVRAINHSVHRTTGMRPVDVTHKNAQDLYKKLYGEAKQLRIQNKQKNKGKYNVGDLVRISEEKGAFTRGYTPNFSKEVFVVAKKLFRDQIVYQLKDFEGEDLTSIFYEPELVRVRLDGPTGQQ